MTDIPRVSQALVADDDPTLRLLLSQALGNWGYSVLEASDGQQAVDMAIAHQPAIVFMDLLMPVLDGYAACQAIRRSPEAAHIPIIVVTGREDIEAIEAAFQAGATDFTTKPINWPLLRHRLQFVLRASDAFREVKASEQRYALAARGANDGLWDWDLLHNRIYFAPRWKQMLGYTEDAVGEDPSEWFKRVHPDDLPRLSNTLDEHLSGRSDHFENEHRMLAADGSYRWMLCRGLAIRDDLNTAMRIAGSQSDITLRKQAESQLAHDAYHDTLTQLPNRLLFHDRLQHAIRAAQRRPNFRFAVLFMDIDRFKVINDSLGHPIGDRVILEVAARVGSCIRDNDTLSRLGGDEFTVLIEDIADKEFVTELVERIQTVVGRPFQVDGHELRPSLSIGVTLSHERYENADEMLRDADTAMYCAKKTGKGQFALFDAEMHMQALHSLMLESEIRSAMSSGQFILRFQPIVAMSSGRTVGLEALLRWQHPRRGELLPEAFLSSAEETGLIVPLGRWVLRETCRHLIDWERSAPLPADWFVSVNCSVREFHHPGFAADVEKILEEHGLAPARLRIEITEQVINHNRQSAEAVLKDLHRLGIRVGIDDFGSTASTLSSLENLPIDFLKIDRSFMHNVDGENRMELIKAVVTLVHQLNMFVVGEGSETVAEVERLNQLACEYGQGNYFQKPVLAHEVVPMLLKGSLPGGFQP